MIRVLALAALVVAALPAAAPARPDTTSARATVKVAYSANLKTKIIVAGSGLTLYYFVNDVGGIPTCYDDATYHCTKEWPPFLTSGAPVAGAGVKRSLLGTVERSDHTVQVTYNKHPLYRFACCPPDSKAGDVYGQAVLELWYVLSPAGKPIKRHRS